MTKLITTAFLMLFSFSAFAGKTIPAGSYTIDPAHSKIGFEIAHLVIATVEGRFTKFDGSIKIEPSLDKSSAKITIDVASLNTDNPKREEHLLSPDFFDVKKNPNMTFTTKKVLGMPEDLKLVGDLTIAGKTKEITLSGKYLGDVNDPWGLHRIAFNAHGKISRKDFGLMWNNMVEAGPVVGDEVNFSIKIEATKPIEKKK